jgi:hypothetical protein
MRWTLVCFLLLGSFISYTQHFIKSYEILPLHNERGKVVILDDEYFYVQLGAVCQTTSRDCSMIAKLDHEGHMVDTTVMDFIDGGASTFIKEDDQLYLGGHAPFLTEKLPLIQKLDTNLDSLELKVLDSLDEFSFFLVAHMIRYGDYFVVSLIGIDTAGNDTARLLWIDNEGNIDTTFRYTNALVNRCYDLKIGADGLLYVGCLEYNQITFMSRVFYKYDINKEEVWKYASEFKMNDMFFINMDPTGDDGVVFIDSWESNPGVPSVVYVDSAGVEQWKYDFNFDDGRIAPYEIINASNGDIIGVGSNNYVHDVGIVGNSAFIFRMNDQGEMLWRREYRKIDEERDLPLDMLLFDIEELDNGDLVMTGRMDRYIGNHNKDDLLFMRTDANGCVDGDCGEIEYVTNAEEVKFIKEEIRVYPNPASSVLNIDVESPSEIKIYNVDGVLEKQASSSNKQLTILIEDLSPGIYFIKVKTKAGKVMQSKFIKI